MSTAFDTLKFVEKLEAGGFSPGQARAAAGAFVDATGEQLATKADLRGETTALQADLRAGLSDLRGEMASMKAELRAETSDLRGEMASMKAELRAEISDAKAELLKWMFGQTLLIIGVLMALPRFGH